jgi:hypothetical protein
MSGSIAFVDNEANRLYLSIFSSQRPLIGRLCLDT